MEESKYEKVGGVVMIREEAPGKFFIMVSRRGRGSGISASVIIAVDCTIFEVETCMVLAGQDRITLLHRARSRTGAHNLP